MTHSLFTPIHSYTFRMTAMAMGLGVIAAAVAWTASPRVDVPPPPPVTQEVLAPVPMPTVVSVEQPAAPARSSEIDLVFRAGGATYMMLAPVGDPKDAEAMPKHGRPTLFDRGEADDWQTASIAVVAERDVPLANRRWIGKTVVVDGTCYAKVTGFAVVARLTGDPGYAPREIRAWTAANVLELGAPVLAAKLDGCKQGTFARDAALSPIVVPKVIEDAALANRARAKLLASSAAKAAQHEWLRDGRDGTWHDDESATVRTLIVRHPTTDVTWVSVHARIEEGCGAPDINIWGLYRVDGDQLVTAQQRDLGELYSVDRLIDLEGDGELEFIGAPWVPTDTVVSRASGDEVTRLQLPFFGCPC